MILPFHRTVLLLTVVVRLSVPGHAQSADQYPSFKEVKAKYPGEHAVMLEDSKKLSVRLVKGKPVLEETLTEVYMILDQTGVTAYNEGRIDFATGEEIRDIRAYTLLPEKGRRTVKEFRTQDVLSGGYVFYDGSRQTTFDYGGLTVGAIRCLTYKRIVSEARFPSIHLFSATVPVLNSFFEIEAVPEVDIFHALLNSSDDNVAFSSSADSQGQHFRWETDSSFRLRPEPQSPGILTYVPHVVAQIRSYTVDGKTIPVLGNTDDLHRWYEENIAEVVAELPDPDLKRVTDSVTAGLDSDFEKVRAVYYWVQDNIKYIAFEEGIGGFVPRQPSSVMHKRYGDCKDMASLIYSMLKTTGIDAQLTWVGTRSRPYRYEDLSSAITDDHMIATYTHQGRVYVLDATSPFQPIDLPSGFIQGKQLLIHQSPGSYTIYPLPVPPPGSSVRADSTLVRINGTAIEGKSRAVLTGYWHIDLFHAMRNAADDIRRDRLSILFQKGNNSFAVGTPRFTGLEDRSADAVLEYDFTVQNCVTVTPTDLFLNLVLDKATIASVNTRQRKTAIEFDNCSSQVHTTVLEIPEGYVVSGTPKNSAYSSEYIDYAVTYTVSERTVTCRTELTVKKLVIPVSDFGKWNAFQAERDRSLTQRIVLSKK